VGTGLCSACGEVGLAGVLVLGWAGFVDHALVVSVGGAGDGAVPLQGGRLCAARAWLASWTSAFSADDRELWDDAVCDDAFWRDAMVAGLVRVRRSRRRVRISVLV
jgi:hypothetical protein